MNQQQTPSDERPEFMIYLGLLPPYSLEDVHKAYKARAVAVHPDHGGSTADFLLLQENYGRAQEYVKFQEGRRQWLAAQVEPYLHQQEIVAEVERRGGRVEIQSLDWMNRSFGDFAALADRLRTIKLRDCPDGDGFLKYLAENAEHLKHLHGLELAGGTVTDAGIESLLALGSLARISLAGTRITASAIKRLAPLEHLEWLNVTGIPIGLWTRWQLRWVLRDVEIVIHAKS